jgi:hypothetical protein
MLVVRTITKKNTMKYFYDTEFLEGTQELKTLGIRKDLFLHIISFSLSVLGILTILLVKTPNGVLFACMFAAAHLAISFIASSTKHTSQNTIDLISIGIVSEDGREYYAISKDFNLNEAWNRFDLVKGDKVYWIRQNVLFPIYREHVSTDLSDICPFNITTMRSIIDKVGKSRQLLAEEIEAFCRKAQVMGEQELPVFYGYYSAYDHVCLSWIFGKMIDLPSGFPMYTIDLKQMIDTMPVSHEVIRNNPNYPEQENAHNAINDAKWNYSLYRFLQTL